MGKNWAIILLTSLAMAPVHESATAAGISLDAIPSLRLEQGWESNIYNTSSGEISDFYFRARPELALRLNTPGAGIRLAGSLEGTWYYDNPAANEEPTWNFTLGLSGGDAVQITQALSVVPSVYYINTFNSSRRTQLLPSADPVAPPVTIATYQNTRSQDFGGGLTLAYQATPNLSLGLSGNYGERRFDNNEQGLEDSTTAGGNAYFSYRFAPDFSAGLGISGSHNTYETSPDSDVVSAGILFQYQARPDFRVDGRIGMSYVRQQSSPGIPEQNDSAPSGRIGFSYLSGTIAASVYGSANYSASSGFGGTTRELTAGFGISDQFAAEWSWNLGGVYQQSRSVFQENAVDLDSVYGTGGLRYRPWDWISLDVAGTMNWQLSNGTLGSDQVNYSGFLGVTLGRSYNVF